MEDDLDLSIEEILNLATKPRSPAKKNKWKPQDSISYISSFERD